jgi:hypothetical protein
MDLILLIVRVYFTFCGEEKDNVLHYSVSIILKIALERAMTTMRLGDIKMCDGKNAKRDDV